MNVKPLISAALAPSGINLVATASRGEYDARAPAGHKAADLLPGALGLVVVGSGGGDLFRAFRAECEQDPSLLEKEHPLDTFVRRALARTDHVLRTAGVPFRRFEPVVYAEPRLNFIALGEIAGLGVRGPFGMLIHPVYGPWFGLRGAYFVVSEVDSADTPVNSCEGCARPCVVGAPAGVSGFSLATFETRRRCIVGPQERYTDEQIRFHEKQLARAIASGACEMP